MITNQTSMQQVLATASSVLANLRSAQAQANNFATWLAAQADADLGASPGLGFSPGDISNLRGAFDDWALLSAFANGGPDPGKPPGYNFWGYGIQVLGPTAG